MVAQTNNLSAPTDGKVAAAVTPLSLPPYSVLVVVIIFAVIPWRYVYSQYVTRRGDRWRSDPSRPVETRVTPTRIQADHL